MIRYACDICGIETSNKKDIIECTMNVLNSSENIEVQLCKECAEKFAGGVILRKWRSLSEADMFDISTHRCTAARPNKYEITTAKNERNGL